MIYTKKDQNTFNTLKKHFTNWLDEEGVKYSPDKSLGFTVIVKVVINERNVNFQFDFSEMLAYDNLNGIRVTKFHNMENAKKIVKIITK